MKRFVALLGLVSVSVWAGGWPEAGDEGVRFGRFDAALRGFVRSNDVGAAVAAVGVNGEVVHLRALGFADQGRSKPLPLNARFRIASVSKPITAAGVKVLFGEGMLSRESLVCDILKAPVWPVARDGRWGQISMGHLLEHRGGWSRERWGDPMFALRKFRAEVGREARKPDDVVRWMLGQPLQFDPGAEDEYSNFGYCVLGRVIESVSGTNYMAFVRERVGKRCGVSSWALARDGERLADEVWYDRRGEFGTYFNIELMDAHGGIVSSAADLCRFMGKFWLTGDARSKGQRGSAAFYGSLPGTTAIAVQRGDGVDFAVLLNRRRAEGNQTTWHEELRGQLDEALD